MKTPPTLIPRTPFPKSGLILSRGTYKAEYSKLGKRHYRSLGTLDPDLARERRDAFYKELRAAGALIAGSPEAKEARRQGITADSDYGITEIKKPFVVKIGKEYLGTYRTRAEALEVRNRHLGIKETP